MNEEDMIPIAIIAVVVIIAVAVFFAVHEGGE
jgi:nitrogen fixation-related uncharacterized protein